MISELQLKLEAEPTLSQQPMPIREKTPQHRQPEGAEEAIRTEPEKMTSDPENSVHAQNATRGGILVQNATGTAPVSSKLATEKSNSPPVDFGQEDDEYLSGYKLFAALFGIISVFFIILLDFSIISTVRTHISRKVVPHVVDLLAK